VGQVEDVNMDGMAGADAGNLTPGVISSYRNTWRQLWKYFFILFLYLLVINAVSFLFSYIIYPYIWENIWEDWQILVLVFAYNFLITEPLVFGFSYIALRAARKEKVGVWHLFAPFRYYHHMVIAAVIYIVIVYIPLFIFVLAGEFAPILGFFLIIILGIFMIIAACKLMFIPFLVTDRGLNAFSAVKTSWHMTDGHAGKVFLILLLDIPFLIASSILLAFDVITAGIICLVVGVIIFIWMYLALAFLFHAIDTNPRYSSFQPGGPSDYRMPGYTGSRDRTPYPPDDLRRY
jgi:hypothetical protein